MDNYDNYRPEIDYTEESIEASGTGNSSNKSAKTTPGQDRNKVKEKKRKKNDKEKVKPKSEKKEEHSFLQTVQEKLTSQNLKLITGIFLGCFAVYLTLSFLSYFTDCIKDQSVINHSPVGYATPISNVGGEGGARISEFLINETFGLGSVVLIVWLIAMSLKLLVGKPRFKSVNFTIKCFVALITVSLIIGLLTISFNSTVNWGGYHGRYINEFIIHFIGWTGASLLCIFMLSLFIIICLRDVVNWIIRLHRKHQARLRELARIKEEKERKERELARMKKEEEIDAQKAGESLSVPVSEESEDLKLSFGIANDIDEDDSALYSLPASETATYHQGSMEYPYPPHSQPAHEPVSDNRENGDSDEGNEKNINREDLEDNSIETISEADRQETTSQNPDDLSVGERDDELRIKVNQIGQSGEKHYKPGEDHRNGYKYAYPPFSLLRPGIERISVDEDEQIENKERIKKTLLDFGIPITSIEATVGPTVTLYEIVPDKGVKISKIRSLVDDIALSLAAIGVRIIAPIPGKGTVGIEVANKDPQTVSMQTVIRSNKFQDSKYELPIALGSTISNDVYITDLTKMPHLLVAGATGQGKSVGLNAIIASLLYCKTPDELKFVMVDPKQVEFSLYTKLKNHYMAMLPGEEECVVTDTSKVEATLSSLVIEMENRYQLLKMAHVRKITEYNAKIKEGNLNPMEGHRFLPYIVVIVDEFSDLIMMSGKNVEIPIARLAQKARAVGMHVIIATQRPSTNVITGIIKANFPARIAFKVSSGVDSKTILDATGAQQLIGRGDMLIVNNSETVRVQCAFIDTPEVEAICDYIERQPYPTGPYELPEPAVGGDDDSSVAGNNFGERDPLFDEVARLVVTSNQASTSSLQRRYSIGYNRAGKIMDQLEAAGIVGPSREGKPRVVLVNDPVILESILEQN